jgi:hypothetical protein
MIHILRLQVDDVQGCPSVNFVQRIWKRWDPDPTRYLRHGSLAVEHGRSLAGCRGVSEGVGLVPQPGRFLSPPPSHHGPVAAWALAREALPWISCIIVRNRCCALSTC